MYNVREDDLRGNWTYATDVNAQYMKYVEQLYME